MNSVVQAFYFHYVAYINILFWDDEYKPEYKPDYNENNGIHSTALDIIMLALLAATDFFSDKLTNWYFPPRKRQTWAILSFLAKLSIFLFVIQWNVSFFKIPCIWQKWGKWKTERKENVSYDTTGI